MRGGVIVQRQTVFLLVALMLVITLPSVSATWWDDGWRSKQAVTIDQLHVQGDLTDYPVYVNISSLGSTFCSLIQADGDDIRVIDSTDTIQLPMELVWVNKESCTGELYFKTNVSSTTNTSVNIYFENNAATSVGAKHASGSEAVWSSYEAVFHLNNSGATVIDASGNMNGSNIDLVQAITPWGTGYTFDSTVNERVEWNVTGSTFMQDNASDFMISMSLKANENASASYAYEAYDATANDVSRFRILEGVNGSYVSLRQSDELATTGKFDFVGNTWDRVFVRYKNSADNITIWIDNQTMASAERTDLKVISGFRFGNGKNLGEQLLPGSIIDEMRLRSVLVGNAWVYADSLNMRDPDTFYTIGEKISHRTTIASSVLNSSQVDDTNEVFTAYITDPDTTTITSVLAMGWVNGLNVFNITNTSVANASTLTYTILQSNYTVGDTLKVNFTVVGGNGTVTNTTNEITILQSPSRITSFSLSPASVTVATESTNITMTCTSTASITTPVVEVWAPSFTRVNLSMTNITQTTFFRVFTPSIVEPHSIRGWCTDNASVITQSSSDLTLSVSSGGGGGGAGSPAGGGSSGGSDDQNTCGFEITSPGGSEKVITNPLCPPEGKSASQTIRLKNHFNVKKTVDVSTSGLGCVLTPAQASIEAKGTYDVILSDCACPASGEKYRFDVLLSERGCSESDQTVMVELRGNRIGSVISDPILLGAFIAGFILLIVITLVIVQLLKGGRR